MDVLKCIGVRKLYGTGSNQTVALDGIDLTVEKGEFIAIVGASGSGKSTLLHILGSVDQPTEGKILVDGTDVSSMNATQSAIFRRRKVGLVYQFYNLIPSLTAYENVALTKSIVKNAKDAKTALEEVGLTAYRDKFPAQLSGGEQQRVSIARALAKNPRIILGDEPTGALDSETGKIVLELIQKQSREKHHTVVLVTHNADIAKCADKIIRMKNGKIVEITTNESPLSVEEVAW